MKTLINKISENWKSGLTVSLISIPLSVSLAVASQASPVMGIVTAIWAGLIASIFGGSNFNIVGPTGALSGIIATYAITHGVSALPMLAVVSGVIILIAYLLRFEKYLIYVPASTIQGFTLGVAFIIALNQLNSALGLTGLEVRERFIENLFISLEHISQTSLLSLSVFLVFLVLLFVFAKYIPKLPGAIILAPVGILLGYLSTNGFLNWDIITLGGKYSEISPSLFLTSTFSFDRRVLIPALTVSIVAILETMISAKVADGMTQTKHEKRKEILGLGLANVFTGLTGGIPATAALARTSLNIKAGANDKMSATLNSIFIILISFVFLTYFKYIPRSVIASILVFVAIRMVETHYIVRMWKYDRPSLILTIFVALVTVVEDPIVGLLVGAVVALLMFVDNISKGHFDLTIKETKGIVRINKEELAEQIKDTHTLVYTIKGALVYINGEAHLLRFEKKLNGSKNIIIRLRELYFIDLDGIDIFDEIVQILKDRKINIYISGVQGIVEEMLLNDSDFYPKLNEEGFVFDKTEHALGAIEKKSK